MIVDYLEGLLWVHYFLFGNHINYAKKLELLNIFSFLFF